MKDAQQDTSTTLRRDLNKLGTYPILTETVLHYLKSWTRQEEPTFTARLLPYIHLHQILMKAAREQDTIGWNHFLRGRIISKKWAQLQHSFTTNEGKN